MTDIFEEVEEQLRSDRYLQLFQKGWPWALGVFVAVVLVLLGYWGYHRYRIQEAAKASETYAAAMETLEKGDSKRAYVEFGEAAKGSSRGYRSLALMEQGGIELGQGRTEAAVALFDKAAGAAPDYVIGDVARLKSALALVDTAPYAAIEGRLKPLIDTKRPYRSSAREVLALSKLRAGRLADARGDFVVLTLSSDAPEPMRQRAQLAVAAIDSGAAASIPAAVKAALALPPPPPALPDLSTILPQAQAQAGADQ